MLQFSKNKILTLVLFLFSLLINQYYGNKGIFPVDSFAHFDTGYRILLGEYPFKDYWIVSGPFVDYLQSIFFYLFGVNWQSYVFHASLLNAILSVATFFVLINFKLNIYYSFIYAFFFSVLAYPTSGTPFVDHHSAFLSLLGIYSLILGIKKEEIKYWSMTPIFFILAFLSKQVPSSYVILSIIFILLIFLIFKKKFYWIKYSLISTFLFTVFLFIFGKIQSIELNSFLEQYIYYPQTIASERFTNFSFTFAGVIDHFKFIYVAILPLFLINLRKIFIEKNYLSSNNFYYFLILFLFTFSLVFHQLLTRNQTFIFFLIPILFAFSHIYFTSSSLNINKFISLIFISICLFATIKYHIRFNENRKFHELNYVDFNFFESAKKIDTKFYGLKWITPEYKNDSNKEIEMINEIKLHLSNDKNNKMLMTNYSFFSSILEEKLHSPSRWYIFDGTDYPLEGNQYFQSYKKFLIKIIKNNDINVIYIIDPVESSLVYKYIDKNCFTESEISSIFKKFKIKECSDING